MTDTFDPNRLPLVAPLPRDFSLRDAFLRLQALPYRLWLDSCGGPQSLSRYSFLTADPVNKLTIHGEDPQALRRIADRAACLQQPSRADLPPFQGGLAGVIAYDFGRTLEPIPDHRHIDFRTPSICLGLYDWVIAWDHEQLQGWIISQGWPERTEEARYHLAQQRLRQVQAWLNAPPPHAVYRPTEVVETPIAPQYTTRAHGVTSNFSSSQYREAVDRVVEYIRAGDVFQVNLAQRLMIPDRMEPALRYLKLREVNQAPFAGYFDAGSWQLLSSSPERLLRLSGDYLETRPIKGTCPKTGDAQRDAALARQLMDSEKDRAENVMIVDLMRNDLSRVCHDESVRVAQLCQLEPYARVQHLVSVVEGRLRSPLGLTDIIEAIFPGGSITGAPKRRAMEIIAELEPTRRGAYCGAFGYWSCGNQCDFNILIRSITAVSGWLLMPVGGGITVRSDPIAEEQETWDKAAGMLAAI